MVQNQSMHHATNNRAQESCSGAKTVANLAFPPAVFSPASSYFLALYPHKGKVRNTRQPNNFVSKAKLNQPPLHSRSEEITMQKVFRSSVLPVLLALPLASTLLAASHRACSSEGTRSLAGPGVPFPKLPPPPPAAASLEFGPGVPFPRLPPPPSAQPQLSAPVCLSRSCRRRASSLAPACLFRSCLRRHRAPHPLCLSVPVCLSRSCLRHHRPSRPLSRVTSACTFPAFMETPGKAPIPGQRSSARAGKRDIDQRGRGSFALKGMPEVAELGA